jgi:hypothetical protein
MRHLFSLPRIASLVGVKAAACRLIATTSLQAGMWNGLAEELDDVVNLLNLHVASTPSPSRLVEEIAEFVEHLRDEHSSAMEPVGTVARLIRERFGTESA